MSSSEIYRELKVFYEIDLLFNRTFVDFRHFYDFVCEFVEKKTIFYLNCVCFFIACVSLLPLAHVVIITISLLSHSEI